jgi:hypothetical protein
MRVFKYSHCQLLALIISSGLAMASTAPSKTDIEQEARRQQQAKLPHQLNKIYETQDVCAGSVPPGWIHVNDHWNPTVCGNPTDISPNVWTIERYDNLPIGSTLTACAGTVPVGWALVGTGWNPTSCGEPVNIENNIEVVKRLN